MEIDITELNNRIKNKIEIDKSYSFSEDELQGTEIRKLDNLKIDGYITKDVLNNICIFLEASGTMILPCSVTLKDVLYPFSFKIEGNLEEIEKENEYFLKKSENTIDIFPIIWENILMEVPIRITNNDNVKMEGEGWKLVTEKKETTNPAFLKLKDLLNEK